MRIVLRLVFIGIWLVSLSFLAKADQQAIGDYHFSYYKDMQGSVDALEGFTKQPDKRVFFGVTCSRQSPLPLIQLIAFDDEILTEKPSFLEVVFKLSGKALDYKLNGIVQVVDTADELSNKIRFEIDSPRKGSFVDYQNRYMELLNRLLAAGDSLTVEVTNRKLGSKTYQFSLRGLKRGLADNIEVCR